MRRKLYPSEKKASRTFFLLRPIEMLIDWHYDRKTQRLVDRAFRVVRRDRDELIHGTPA